MFGLGKKKVEKIVKGSAPYRLLLYKNYDFELNYRLDIPKDWWVQGILKIERKFKKKGLRRVDGQWDELPIDMKSLSLIEKKLLKEVMPSVLEKELPLHKKRSKGKTLGFSSASLKKLVIFRKAKGSKHLAKMLIKGIWYDE